MTYVYPAWKYASNTTLSPWLYAHVADNRISRMRDDNTHSAFPSSRLVVGDVVEMAEEEDHHHIADTRWSLQDMTPVMPSFLPIAFPIDHHQQPSFPMSAIHPQTRWYHVPSRHYYPQPFSPSKFPILHPRSIIPTGAMTFAPNHPSNNIVTHASFTGMHHSSPTQDDPSSIIPAYQTLQILSSTEFRGRRSGTPGHDKVQQYIVQRFEEMGLRPFLDAPRNKKNAFHDGFRRSFVYTDDYGARYEITNLVGYLRGTHYPDKYIIITAHYDHLGYHLERLYLGADDNASGTAALITLGDVLSWAIATLSFNDMEEIHSDPTGTFSPSLGACSPHAIQWAVSRGTPWPPMAPRHSIILFATDGEELGLVGSNYFVDKDLPVDKEDILLNINIDMIGRHDSGKLYIAGTHQFPALRDVIMPVIRPFERYLTIAFGQDDPNRKDERYAIQSSDQFAFYRIRVPFLFINDGLHADYHTHRDTADKIDPQYYHMVIQLVYAILLHMDHHVLRDANDVLLENAHWIETSSEQKDTLLDHDDNCDIVVWPITQKNVRPMG